MDYQEAVAGAWIDKCAGSNWCARGCVYLKESCTLIWGCNDGVYIAPVVDAQVEYVNARHVPLGIVKWLWGFEASDASATVRETRAAYNLEHYWRPPAQMKLDGAFLLLREDFALEIYAVQTRKLKLCSRAVPLTDLVRIVQIEGGATAQRCVAVSPGAVVVSANGYLVALEVQNLNFRSSSLCMNVTQATAICWSEDEAPSGAVTVEHKRLRRSAHREIVTSARNCCVRWNLTEANASYCEAVPGFFTVCGFATHTSSTHSDSVTELVHGGQRRRLPRAVDGSSITCGYVHPDGGAFLFLDSDAVIYVTADLNISVIPDFHFGAETLCEIAREHAIEGAVVVRVVATSTKFETAVLRLRVLPSVDIAEESKLTHQLSPCADFVKEGKCYTICGGIGAKRTGICQVASRLNLLPRSTSSGLWHFSSLYSIHSPVSEPAILLLCKPLRTSSDPASRLLRCERRKNAIAADSEGANSANWYSKLDLSNVTLACARLAHGTLCQVTEETVVLHQTAEKASRFTIAHAHRAKIAPEFNELITITYREDSSVLRRYSLSAEANAKFLQAEWNMPGLCVLCVERTPSHLFMGTIQGLFCRPVEQREEEPAEICLSSDTGIQYVCTTPQTLDSPLRSDPEDEPGRAQSLVLLLVTMHGEVRYASVSEVLNKETEVLSLQLLDSYSLGTDIDSVVSVAAPAANLLLIFLTRKTVMLTLSGDLSLHRNLKESPLIRSIRSMAVLDGGTEAVWLDRGGELHTGELLVSDYSSQYLRSQFKSKDLDSIVGCIECIESGCYLVCTIPNIVYTSPLGFMADTQGSYASELILIECDGRSIIDTLRLRLNDFEIIERISHIELPEDLLGLCDRAHSTETTPKMYVACTQVGDGTGRVHLMSVDPTRIELVGRPLELDQPATATVSLRKGQLVMAAADQLFMFQVKVRPSASPAGFTRASRVPAASDIVSEADEKRPSSVELVEIAHVGLRAHVTDLQKIDDTHIVVSTLFQSCTVLEVGDQGFLEITGRDTYVRSSTISIGVISPNIFVTSRQRKQIGFHVLLHNKIDDHLVQLRTELYPLECQINKYRPSAVQLPWSDDSVAAVHWLDIEGNLGVIAPIYNPAWHRFLKKLEQAVFRKANIYVSYQDFWINGIFVDVLLRRGPKFQNEVVAELASECSEFLGESGNLMNWLLSIKEAY